MLSWTDIWIAKLRHEQMMREAEEHRLIRKAMRQRNTGRSLRHRVLAWLGKMLVIWGHNLQERYAQRITTLQNETMKVG